LIVSALSHYVGTVPHLLVSSFREISFLFASVRHVLILALVLLFFFFIDVYVQIPDATVRFSALFPFLFIDVFFPSLLSLLLSTVPLV
jgi:hypothetical protein